MEKINSAEQLHERASTRRGLTDFGTQDYLEGLGVLLEGYATEAGLTEAGVKRVNRDLQAVLEARLVTEESWRLNPTYANTPVSRPIFVTGLPRSGTTALHRLLCLDSGHQGLEQWLADFPQPRPPREDWPDQADYQRVRDALEARHRANPGFHGVHFMSADSVEECGRLDRQTMRSRMFGSVAHLPGYTTWLRGQDLDPVYQRHRRGLQLIGMNDPARRWVLKWPSHMFALDSLMRVFPDALVVQTHRDPRTVIGSISSLCQKASAGTSTVLTDAVLGADNLERWSVGADLFREARKRYDPSQFVDVFYDDFIADAGGTVERIYKSFGLDFTDATHEAVRQDNQASKLDQRRPVHRYSLEDFGLDERQVVDRFAAYMETYGFAV